MTTNKPMIVDRPEVGEFNGLVDGISYHNERGTCESVCWTTPGLHVTRFRILSDPLFPAWDISYCHGTLDGKPVDVELPFSQMPKKNWRKFVVEQAKKHGVYAKGLGILTNVSTLS